ncbi:MAG TPA: EAL domain-containing protein [Methylovirgula sp.]|nr:EAL domain-containing protein [Methylovirgula sp.]
MAEPFDANRSEDSASHAADAAPHPRRLKWLGTSALAMGGSNQSLFLITALFVGQGSIPGQGSAAVPLLILGLLLSYAAAPGWIELVLMSPDRVGGIAAACTTAFRRYSPILSALAGVCYWWGWVPTCGVTAILSAAAINQWCLPSVPVPVIACTLVLFFTLVSLSGIRWVARLALPIAAVSVTLAFVSMVAPVLSGQVDWRRAADFHLTVPFPGWFGALTSMMAGLYLIGFGAPAFEAALCHVGETIAPERNVPRAVWASAGMAAVYFAFLPLVWLGALGSRTLGGDLLQALGPTFAPLFGAGGKAAAIGFMMFNMFHGTLQPLAGAARTLSQISEDGLAPRFIARRLSSDAPWVATLLTAGFAVLFLLIGDPIWLIAAANFTYLIGICLPSVAVWLLRRDAPKAPRAFRAPRGTIGLGLAAACVWGASALFGFEQFGLPTVVFGLLMAYSGAVLFAWRKIEDRWRSGLRGFGSSLHVKLTGAMLLVLALDAAGYMLAVDSIPNTRQGFVVGLEDIFVLVAFLTISVGLVLPGVIAHSANEVKEAAQRLAFGTVRDFARAMDALGEGDLRAAHACTNIEPVEVHSRDELGAMAESFNTLQQGIKHAAAGLDRAREGLSAARAKLIETNETLGRTVEEQGRLATELMKAKEAAVRDALHDPLTGLPNRAFFFNRVNAALEAEDRNAHDFALFFLDLDGFKRVNDSLGHSAGDCLLFEVADRLKGLLRNESRARRSLDGRPLNDMLARFGGDEFTVLLSGVKGAADARAVAGRLQNALLEPFTIEGQDVYMSASIGIVASCAGYLRPQDMLRDADVAMYRAKSFGEARVEIYDDSMHAAAKARLELQNMLHRALLNQEFILHYQPIVSLETEEITGFEALLRWQAPGRDLIYPADFISVAEETGLIVPLGLWVLREACRQARAWQSRKRRRRLSMNVNLSPRQFSEPNLARDVRSVLVETGVDPALIKLEITESSTMGDPRRAIAVLSQLKSLGIELSIDDFGTGYSSLSYLHRFPVDSLKIDQSFIAGLSNHPESREVVTTIIGLAHGLKLGVVAEGVETRDQALELRRLGCSFAQGYFFSKPLPAPEIAALLERKRKIFLKPIAVA